MSKAVIKVAADGSEGSRRAFVWAVEEARLRNCGVELVAAYRGVRSATVDQLRRAAEEAVRATMGELADEADLTQAHLQLPPISWETVEGDTVDVLVQASRSAVLLVMGSHRVDGLEHSARSSATDLCTRMASCPVVVVPATSPSEREELVTAPGDARVHQRVVTVRGQRPMPLE